MQNRLLGQVLASNLYGRFEYEKPPMSVSPSHHLGELRHLVPANDMKGG